MSEETTTTANAGDSPEQTEAPAQSFSQEDVDRIVNERLARERKKYEGFDDLKTKAEQFDALATERDELAGKVQEFETKANRAEAIVSISEEYGVPASALRGDTADDLKAHAEVLKSLITPRASTVPGATTKPSAAPANPAQQTVRELFGK